MKPVTIDLETATPLSVGADCPASLAHALAEELVDLTRMLSDLGYDLASDPDTLRRHVHSLQAIDRLTQTQLAIADALRSDAPTDDRIAAITLESLAFSLRRRVGDPPGQIDRPDAPSATGIDSLN